MTKAEKSGGRLNMQKIVTGLCLMIAGLCVPACAQDGAAGSPAEQAFPGTGLGDLMPSVWRLAGALVLVLALVWVTMWIARRVLKGRVAGGRIAAVRVLDRVHLAPRRSIELVSVKDRVLVLGVTDHNISLLTEFTGDEYQEPDSAVVAGPKPGAVSGTPRDLWADTRRLLGGGLRLLREARRHEPASAESAGKV